MEERMYKYNCGLRELVDVIHRYRHDRSSEPSNTTCKSDYDEFVAAYKKLVFLLEGRNAVVKPEMNDQRLCLTVSLFDCSLLLVFWEDRDGRKAVYSNSSSGWIRSALGECTEDAAPYELVEKPSIFMVG